MAWRGWGRGWGRRFQRSGFERAGDHIAPGVPGESTLKIDAREAPRATSIRHNVAASYVGQIYVTLAAILLLPAYVRYMGPEAYGLVGFYAMLQAWFMLLDIGLTPTMVRETARFRGGSIDALSLRRFFRAIEGAFVAMGITGAGSILAASGLIAHHWLRAQHLPLNKVQTAVRLMALIIALRWTSGLYRGVVNGFERLVWLSGLNIVVATLRFVLVVPVLIYLGTSPAFFFGYQLMVAALELTILVAYTYRLLPAIAIEHSPPWQWGPLRGVLRFSLTVAFTSSVWVLVTQTDKLILSKLLPLSEYAYYSLAVLVASGVLVISGPISQALLPRLVRLNAEGNQEALICLYRNATQMVALIAIPSALMLALFARQVLWAWTGNALIAGTVGQVLTLYALGNALLALGAFPYYLQFAKGDLTLHLIGSALFLAILMPTLFWGTLRHGVTGAGYAWLSTTGIFFVVWVPTVHRRFVKGLHRRWLCQDVAGIAAVTAACSLLLKYCVTWPAGRAAVAGLIVLLVLTLTIPAAMASSWVRDTFHRRWRKLLVGV
jgi:O-antigen/teichoic acid export membrane protein